MTKPRPRLFVSLAALAIGIALAVGRAWNSAAVPSPPSVTVTIGETIVVAEVASSPEQQRAGLSGRRYLPPNHGMLFIFPTPRRPAFWMREMNFPLDLLWIADGRVVEITPNTPVPRGIHPLPFYRPGTPVTAVLEVPAGFSQRHHITLGASVQW